MTISLTLAVEDYDWVKPLIEGGVSPRGIDLTLLTDAPSTERHDRMERGEFDAAEYSLSKHITGHPDWPFSAIPAFPRRFFPHKRTFVNADAGIEAPADLAGRRVGIFAYQNTLALWARGIYGEHYDLDIDAVTWCTANPEPVPGKLPVDVERVGDDLVPQLARGDLDALIIPAIRRFHPWPDGVERLFADLRDAERAYFEETGFCPLMHDVVVRDDLLEAHPWVATELADAFRRSQAAYAERTRDDLKFPLVWWEEYLAEERDVFGDLWAQAFELEPNLDELNTMIRYAHEHGVIEDLYDARDLFAETG